MKILKFGGKSLDNGSGILTVLDIIIDNYRAGEAPSSWSQRAVRALMHCSLSQSRLAQVSPTKQPSKPFGSISVRILRFASRRSVCSWSASSRGLSLLGECSPRTVDELVSYGEVLSSQYVAQALKDRATKPWRLTRVTSS